MHIAEDYAPYFEYQQTKVFGEGTYASLWTYILPGTYNKCSYKKMNGIWKCVIENKVHRSKTVFQEIQPFSGYLSNKKWYLNEVGIYLGRLNCLLKT